MNWANIKRIDSSNENVSKFVFENKTAVAEAVLYKYPTYEDRTVICCSTQSGCPVGCRFCGAGDYFVRSLTAEEIVEQPVYLLEQTKAKVEDIKRLQIMVMSMGEPLLNYEELAKAFRVLYARYPQARLLISTSAPRVFGSFEKLNSLSVEIPTIGLQFSVHESTDDARKKLIPTPTMTLEEIARTGEDWAIATGRRPFFNYCVHDNNNTEEDADRLVKHFSPKIWESTLSVICERDEYLAGTTPRQRELTDAFQIKLINRGYSTRVFDPAGQDTANGCGQLWQTQKWMKTHEEFARPSRGNGLPVRHMPH
jgi:23S rRNA (adenine2503-C2)-methyltransferase